MSDEEAMDGQGVNENDLDDTVAYLKRIEKEMEEAAEENKNIIESLTNEYVSTGAVDVKDKAPMDSLPSLSERPSLSPIIERNDADDLDHLNPFGIESDEKEYQSMLKQIGILSESYTQLQSAYSLECAKNEHLRKMNMDVEQRNERLTMEIEKVKRDMLDMKGRETLLDIELKEKDDTIQRLKSQLTNQSRALDERDNDIMKINVELERVKSELEHMKKAYKTREKEVEAASIDIFNMTRENRAVHETCQMLTSEVDKLYATNEELKQKSIKTTAALEQTKIELRDQQLMYRKVCDENSRLKDSLQNISTLRDNSLDIIYQHENESVKLREDLQSSEESRKIMKQDLDKSQMYATDLARRLKLAEARILLLEQERNIHGNQKQFDGNIFQQEPNKKMNISSNESNLTSTISSGYAGDKGEISSSSDDAKVSGLSSSNGSDSTLNGSSMSDIQVRKRDLIKKVREHSKIIESIFANSHSLKEMKS